MITVVSKTENGDVKKVVTEIKDGIKTEKVYINGMEQKPEKKVEEPKKEALKIEMNGKTIEVPYTEHTWTVEDLCNAWKREQEAIMAHNKRVKEEAKKAEEEMERKAREEHHKAEMERIKEEVKKFKKAREENGRFLVRFFVPDEEVRIAEKRFARVDEIYRPLLGENVYLGNWLVDEFWDEYEDTRFVVTDVTMCMEDDEEGTVLIDIDIEPFEEEFQNYEGTYTWA